MLRMFARRSAAFVGATLLICFSTRPGRADEPKRATPDYDGRGSPPPTAGEVALWVPRVLLFPPYLVSEYVIRRPLGALVTEAERKNWAASVIEFFTFGPEHKAGVVPTAFIDFGLQPSVGLYFFWDDALAKGHDLRAHVSYFGSDWVAISGSERLHTGEASKAELDAKWVRRPDYAYYGEGPRTLQSAESRFLASTIDVALSFDLKVTPALVYRASAGIRDANMQDSTYAGDASVDDRVNAGEFALPTDFHSGYTDAYQRMELVFDTRQKRPVSQTGLRVAGHVEHGTDVRATPANSWIRYGGRIAGFLDVWRQRVLGLALWGDLADPLRGGAIPFTEQVVWGGVEPLAGFIPGRLYGRSAAALSLTYTWPIWVWLDGRMGAAVGNVFDAGFRGFDTKLMRLVSGIGVQSVGSPDHRFELLVGFGTETFEHGGQVDSFRLVLGGTNGF